MNNKNIEFNSGLSGNKVGFNSNSTSSFNVSKQSHSTNINVDFNTSQNHNKVGFNSGSSNFNTGAADKCAVNMDILRRELVPKRLDGIGEIDPSELTDNSYIYVDNGGINATLNAKDIISGGGIVQDVKVDGVSILDSSGEANLNTSQGHPYSQSNPLATMEDISASGGGTVTSITAGNGLVTDRPSGAPITSSGTISIDTNVVATKSDLNTKQDLLTQPQMAAVNSGITAERVASYNEKIKVLRNASGTLVFFKESI